MITHLTGDCLAMMRTLEEKSVHTCVTSPPYFGLRDYGADGQIGLEETPEQYVQSLVEVFREVRRVLRDDGTVWLNLGDSYCSTAPGTIGKPQEKGSKSRPEVWANQRPKTPDGMKPKDLMGIPWMVAFALRADGWYLRSEIIWAKPNCMPESVTDRPTKSHEQIFLLAKREKYYFDSEAIKEDAVYEETRNGRVGAYQNRAMNQEGDGTTPTGTAIRDLTRRNKRSVWTVPTSPYSGAHFAVFPPDLIRPCILAGAPLGGTVLDPFGGSGTTGLVAEQEGRHAILIDLNPEYVELQKERTAQMSLLAA